MLAGLDGDAEAHKALLEALSGVLRAYFKHQLTRIGKGSAWLPALCLTAFSIRV